MATDLDTETLFLNQADYARHRGVSRQAINNFVNDGKITLNEDGLIDVVAADLILGETRERITEPRDGGESAGSAQLTRARTFGAVYQARKSQLEYEKMAGSVVEAAGITGAATECGAQVVRIVHSLSSQAEALRSTAADATKFRAELKRVEREMLIRISEAFAKMASDAAATPANDVASVELAPAAGDEMAAELQ